MLAEDLDDDGMGEEEDSDGEKGGMTNGVLKEEDEDADNGDDDDHTDSHMAGEQQGSEGASKTSQAKAGEKESIAQRDGDVDNDAASVCKSQASAASSHASRPLSDAAKRKDGTLMRVLSKDAEGHNIDEGSKGLDGIRIGAAVSMAAFADDDDDDDDDIQNNADSSGTSSCILFQFESITQCHVKFCLTAGRRWWGALEACFCCRAKAPQER
jgi:hypothetical protein